MIHNISFPAPAIRARSVSRLLVAVVLVGTVASCAAPNGQQFNDPYEAQNRENHAANIALDKALVRPASQAYGAVLPAPVRSGIGNFASNLSLPSYVLNDLLQLKVADAGANTLRFAFNTIFGIGGIFDPAGALGLHEKHNDFGETLYVWGVREGAYVEAPLLGPTTERDLAGKVVDVLADPVGLAVPSRLRYLPTGVEIASKLGERYKFTGTFDSILHDSADSYAQERLLFLEKRHYDLGQKSPSATYDPYEDPYGK